MERITSRQVKMWLESWNASQKLQVQLECYNGWYHITVRGTHEHIVEGRTARQCWDAFCDFRCGYFTALNMVG